MAVRGDHVSYEGPVRAMLGLGAAPDFAADQWAARGDRAAGLDIKLIAVYMDDGVGMERQNLARAEQISIFVKALKCQWIIVGDWNFEADTLDRLGWPRVLGGELLLPSADFTCASARGRVIDFGIVSQQLRPLCSRPGPRSLPWDGFVAKAERHFAANPPRGAAFHFGRQAADDGLP